MMKALFGDCVLKEEGHIVGILGKFHAHQLSSKGDVKSTPCMGICGHITLVRRNTSIGVD